MTSSVRLMVASLLVAATMLGPATGATARPAMVTFKVRVPDYTPSDAGIFVSGNIPALGPWDPGKVELGKIGDLTYAITLVVPVGSDLKYKFTRGTWETVEKGHRFEEISDRMLEVVGDETVRVEVENWRDFSPRRESHSVVGDFELHLDFAASKLDNKRTVLVYLPPGYKNDEERRYPVLYMHDGQNLFDAGSSFIGVEWNVDETVSRMVDAGQIDPLIVVGVYNTSDRMFEYTPAPDPVKGGGGASLYADFIVNDVKPFIDSHYRTLPDRAHTGVMGSSLGGLVSLYLGWSRPDVFSRVAAMSTTYWWANNDIIRMVEEADPPEGIKVWIDMGSAEDQTDRDGDGVPDIMALHRRMRDVLMEKGFELSRNLAYVEDDGAVHNERAWAARFPRALGFLFPAAPGPRR